MVTPKERLNKIKFEKSVSAVSTVSSQEELIERLAGLGYIEDENCGLVCFYKGGSLNTKRHIIISNTGENISIQVERAERAAEAIISTETTKKYLIVFVCFAETSHGVKNIFDKYLSYEIAKDSNSGVNGIRPVVYDKKGGQFIFNNYSSFLFHYNKHRKIIVDDIIGNKSAKSIKVFD